MPAKTKGTRKLRSHRTIESVAARVLRRDGTRGANVRKVMTEAGLTVGGFSAHVPSKDGLIRDAFSVAIAQKRRFVAKAIAVLSLAFGALALARAFANFPEGDELLEAASAASKYFTGRGGREGAA